MKFLNEKLRRFGIILFYGYIGDFFEFLGKLRGAVAAGLQAFFDPGYAYDELNSSVLFYPQPM